MPEILLYTSYTNHIAILNQCKTSEERLFYILYAHRERLKVKELQRCISNDTYSSLLVSPTMVAEYKRQLIPKEKMQTLLQEYCDLAQLEKK